MHLLGDVLAHNNTEELCSQLHEIAQEQNTIHAQKNPILLASERCTTWVSQPPTETVPKPGNVAFAAAEKCAMPSHPNWNELALNMLEHINRREIL